MRICDEFAPRAESEDRPPGAREPILIITNEAPTGNTGSSPLASRAFREIWAANLISNLGSLVQLVGASWLMTSLTTSEQMVTLVQASTALPLMLMALWAGAVADRFDRRAVMLASQSFTMLASVGLAALAWAERLDPWSLLCFTFLIGCGAALKTPAWQAGVGEMVPRSALPSAIALNSVGYNIARSVGPALGGIIVVVGGAAAAFVANAASNIGMLVALVRWQRERTPRTLPPERFLSAVAAGVRYATMAPPILAVLPRAALFGFAASGVQALLPLIARDQMRGGAFTYGLLLGAFGIGAVAGGLVIGRLRDHWPSEQLSRHSAMMFAAGTLGVAASPLLPVTLAALALTGAGWVVTLSTMNVTVQLNSPNWVLARILALYQMAAFGGIAAGSWLIGILADRFGVSGALLISAGLQFSVIVLTFRLPLHTIEDLNLTPFSGWNRLDEPFAREQQTGPIVIITEFRIAASDTANFLALMTQRRRIRRRNGGHGWELARDLGDPQLWIERYYVPSWSEYLRHRERLVTHEAAVFGAIKALHIGAEAPCVRRLIGIKTRSEIPLDGTSVNLG